MSKGAVLENTPSTGKLSVAGQNVLDPERSSIIQRGIYQRVQESDGRNWLYYQLFLRQDFDACSILLANCEEPTSPVQGTYGIFMKGLIAKRQGQLQEALGYMKTCLNRDHRNLEVLKELISLTYLTGNYKQALVYVQAAKEIQASEDWFSAHHQALCYEKLDNLDLAEEHFKSAINIQPQERPYLELTDFYIRREMHEKASELLERAKRVFPESTLVAGRLGALQVKNFKDMDKGFGNLAQAASATKFRDDATLLAVGSVMQRKLDPDGALKKYEAILQEPGEFNASLLNNIGLCYFAKRKSLIGKRDVKIAEEEYSHRILQAMSCLKKAQQLSPFDARILRNLGYVTREVRLYATASFYLMSSIRLAEKNAGNSAYMLLAGVADHLEISSQANQLYKYCIKNNRNRDPWVYLNFATFLLRQGEQNRALEAAHQCQLSVSEWEQAGRPVDKEVLDGLKQLKTKINLPDITTIPDVSTERTPSPTGPTGSHGMVVSAQVEPLSPK